ncbi:hypothetical protein BH10ACI3_BH10ACI3_19060 [soil metagenome]
MLKKLSVLSLLLIFGAIGIFAQGGQTRAAVAGQKYKIKGIIVQKDNNSLIVRDGTDVDTKVIIAPNASIKTNGFWGGDKYPASAIIRGLNIDLEGIGDSSGAVSATKIRFDKDNLETAKAIDTRVGPAEERLTAAEQNAQKVSGQIDELMAISNAAKGGAKAAQDTADAAVAGVNATNKRISDLDDYVTQSTATVNFKVGSAVLSPEAKTSLDQVAAASMTLKGYIIEVTGFASAEGSARSNKSLSERRAQTVKDYLIVTHNIPLRRMSTSYGYGAAQAVADNSTREGREQNRRVEVKLLVSRGINQNVEVKPTN